MNLVQQLFVCQFNSTHLLFLIYELVYSVLTLDLLLRLGWMTSTLDTASLPTPWKLNSGPCNLLCRFNKLLLFSVVTAHCSVLIHLLHFDIVISYLLQRCRRSRCSFGPNRLSAVNAAQICLLHFLTLASNKNLLIVGRLKWRCFAVKTLLTELRLNIFFALNDGKEACCAC